MQLLRRLAARFHAIFQKRRLDRELDEELRTHVEILTQRKIDAGLRPEAARYAALKQFGWVESVKETCREQRGVSWLENAAQDLRYAVRVLRRNPAFTAVAVLTLALGIGANTAIFSLVNALLLRPLPLREPDRLVWVANSEPGGAGVPGTTRSVNVRDWRSLNQSLEGLGCYVAWFGRPQTILKFNGESTRIEGAMIDREFLRVLGVSPRLGREFLEDDGLNAVILTDTFWKRQFQADPALVGKPITINGRPWTVVGVLPPSFDFASIFMPGIKLDFLRPAIAFGDMSDNSHAVIGRLKSGVSLRQAQAEFDGLNARLRDAYPERGPFGARLTPLREHVSGSLRRPLLVLAGAVACVLLIACVNLSNLLLARAAARRKEIAVRSALGAGRWRLIRQLLTESLLLSACGAALALPLAYAATTAMARSQAFDLPLLATVRVDGAALGFTLLIACSTGVLFGIAPALQISFSQVQEDLKDSNRGAGQSKRRVWIRESLVISEIALACVLLVGAGLLLRSFVRLLDVDLGFQPEQVIACRLRTPRDFATNTQAVAYFSELSRRVEAIAGVESVGFAGALPFAVREVAHVRAEGETYGPGDVPSVFMQGGDPGYFKTLRIPLLAGRTFDARDPAFDFSARPSGTMRVVINDKMARQIWPGKNPVGQIALLQENGNVGSDTFPCEVIGVVGNVRQSPLEPEAAPQIYLVGSGGELVFRTKESVATLAPAVRAALRQFEPGMIIGEFKPLTQIVDQVVSPKRLITLLAGLFSGLALALAAVGLYGVIAYSVSQRTQEIGIRLALGASKSAVLSLIMRAGMKLGLVGCGIGVLASAALTRVIQSLLFGVTPTDPTTFLASALLLLAVALLACWLPARRAARLDPMVALRHE